jgi:hypothetical protein
VCGISQVALSNCLVVLLTWIAVEGVIEGRRLTAWVAALLLSAARRISHWHIIRSSRCSDMFILVCLTAAAGMIEEAERLGGSAAATCRMCDSHWLTVLIILLFLLLLITAAGVIEEAEGLGGSAAPVCCNS